MGWKGLSNDLAFLIFLDVILVLFFQVCLFFVIGKQSFHPVLSITNFSSKSSTELDFFPLPPLPSQVIESLKKLFCPLHQGKESPFPSTLFWKQTLFSFFLSFFLSFFMAVLGLRFCARAFSSCGKRGPLFITVRGPLTIAASLVAEHRLQTRRLSNCGSRAQLLRGMWDRPRPGLEPVSPALAADSQPLRHQGSPRHYFLIHFKKLLN